jgi:hypothetical protein
MISEFTVGNIAFYPACPIINNSFRGIQWIFTDDFTDEFIKQNICLRKSNPYNWHKTVIFA